MQAIVLAAGVGSRMRPMTIDTPKCLLRVDGETLLQRMLRQLSEYPDVERIVLVAGHAADRLAASALTSRAAVQVVFNHEFACDDNLMSVRRAFEAVDRTQPVILLDSDLWLDDAAVRAIIDAGRAGDAALCTRGAFDPGTEGSALRHTSDGRVDELLVGVEWEPGLASHRELFGAAIVGSRQTDLFAGLLDDAARRGESRYELAWARSLHRLETHCVDLSGHRVASLDTAAQYEALCDSIRRWRGTTSGVRLVPLEWLRPVETARPERVQVIGDRMAAEAIWHRALVVDSQQFIVLDGTQRLEAARARGLRHVPVVMVDYETVPVWSLQPGREIARESVVERVLAGDLFEAGTVKHQLPPLDLNCRFVLTRLAA